MKIPFNNAIRSLCLGLALLVAVPCAARAQADDQRTADAAKALEERRYQDAYDLYSELVREYPANDTINFNFAQAAVGVGKPSLAIFAYERVLMRNPSADRIRLEMGRTYMLMGQNDNARQEFQTVLSHNPPENVKTNVEALLAAMTSQEKRYRVSGQLSVGYLYDDNVNTGLISDNVSTILGTITMAPGSSPRNDTAKFGAFGLGYDYKLDEKGAWVASFGGLMYQSLHDRVESTDMNYRKLSAGIQHFTDKWSVSLPLKYEHVDYGWKDLVDIYGIEPAVIYFLTQKLFLVTQGQLEMRDNLQADSFKDKDSAYYALGEYVRLFFGDENHEFMAGGQVFQEDAVDPVNSNMGFELSARLSLNLVYGLKFYSQLVKRDSYYNTLPSPLASDRRYDQQYRATVGLSKDLWVKDLNADFNVQLTRNDSNFGTYSYDRKVATISLNYSF